MIQVKKLQDQKVELQNNIRSNQQMEKRCETKLMKLGEKISNLKYVSEAQSEMFHSRGLLS